MFLGGEGRVGRGVCTLVEVGDEKVGEGLGVRSFSGLFSFRLVILFEFCFFWVLILFVGFFRVLFFLFFGLRRKF